MGGRQSRSQAGLALLLLVLSLLMPSAAGRTLSGTQNTTAEARSSRYGGVNLRRMDKAVKNAMRREKVVGAAVALWGGGEDSPMFRSYGFADKVSKRRVDEDTVFMAASVSKAVVGKFQPPCLHSSALLVHPPMQHEGKP